MLKGQKISAIIPALNEEQAIGKVVSHLVNLKDLNNQPIIDDVIVCDNGSGDKTAMVAKQYGARVVSQTQPGYGIACLTAISALNPCDIVLFVDGDDSCFVEQSKLLLNGIIDGDDLAIGSRVLGKIEKGALTPVQQFGNWLASQLINLFWQYKTTDLGPFRAIRYNILKQLSMQDTAFGWTVEMQIKAIQLGLNIGEYPVDSKIRIGHSKISGTISGSIKAGIGILSTIAILRIKQRKMRKQFALENSL